MTDHDLAMFTVGQYWKRAYRTGYAYAAVAARHGFNGSAFWRYELGRILAACVFTIWLRHTEDALSLLDISRP